MTHSYIKWTLNVNSNTLNDFYKTCKYLHIRYNQNCFYNKSSAFQYIINNFNKEIELHIISQQSLIQYHSKIKKDKEIGISLFDYDYFLFLQNCKKFKISRNNMIRILMLKLIDETDSTEIG